MSIIEMLPNYARANHNGHFSEVNLNRGSYMSAHVLLDLLNEFGKKR